MDARGWSNAATKHQTGCPGECPLKRVQAGLRKNNDTEKAMCRICGKAYTHADVQKAIKAQQAISGGPPAGPAAVKPKVTAASMEAKKIKELQAEKAELAGQLKLEGVCAAAIADDAGADAMPVNPSEGGKSEEQARIKERINVAKRRHDTIQGYCDADKTFFFPSMEAYEVGLVAAKKELVDANEEGPFGPKDSSEGMAQTKGGGS